MKNIIFISYKILIEIGTIDPACVGDFDLNKITEYLKMSFNNCKLNIDIIKGANHHYAGCEKELVENLKSFVIE